MPRLSIVIPASGVVQDLESTLISVLANRPDESEVVVVLNRPYADPYQLTDEVRFVEARSAAGWAELATTGLAASQASIVHLLQSGVEVVDGWSAAAMAHFDDPRVLAVSPLVRDRDCPQRVLATGLAYEAGGRRVIAGAGSELRAAISSAGTILAPTRLAGFYRKSLVEGVLGGFDRAAGDAVADAELGLRARHAGLRSLFEPRCQVLASAAAATGRLGVRAAYDAERLFWRHRTAAPGATDVLRHAGVVASEFVRALPRPRAFAALVARLAGMLDTRGQRRYEQRLAEIRQAASEGIQRAASELRVDRSHGPRRVRVRMHRSVRPSTAHHDA